jgi:hypothetical protein
VISASAGGKAKTAFQMVGHLPAADHYRYRMPASTSMVDFHRIGPRACSGMSVLLSIVSAVQYTIGFGEAMAQANQKQGD